MMKKFAGMVLAGMAAVMMTTTAFAGEWVTLNDGSRYYNTGYDYGFRGWQWIYENDGVARCYYFDDNGCALTNTTTPDGYKVDYTGAWVKNGKVVTIDYQAGMSQDTDWTRFGGDYYMYHIDFADGSSQDLNASDFPVYIYSDHGNCKVVYCNTGEVQTFTDKKSEYSWESKNGDKLDVDNEDWIRIVDNGATYYLTR